MHNSAKCLSVSAFIVMYECMIVCYQFTDDWVERSYTPVLPLVGDCHNEASEVKLMVKLYNKGAMSSILSSLHIGI